LNITLCILSQTKNRQSQECRDANEASEYLGTPEKGIRRLDPNTANERCVVGPNAWLYSGQ